MPPAFDRREIVIEPGGVLPYDALEWRDALVVVECGEIELESKSGARIRLVRGAIIWLDGLDLEELRNCGIGAAVLSSVRRR